MKCFIKTTHLVLLLLIFLLPGSKIFAQEIKFKYSKDNVANYFSGILSLNQNQISKGFEYLNKVKELKTKHQNFNTQYINSLILLDKFEEAFSFSRSVWKKDEFFFEADLLLGLEYFIKKDYLNAEKHFERLSNKSQFLISCILPLSRFSFSNFVPVKLKVAIFFILFNGVLLNK